MNDIISLLCNTKCIMNFSRSRPLVFLPLVGLSHSPSTPSHSLFTPSHSPSTPSHSPSTPDGVSEFHYQDYLNIDKLLSLQQPKSEEHDEHLFIVVHQGMCGWEWGGGGVFWANFFFSCELHKH